MNEETIETKLIEPRSSPTEELEKSIQKQDEGIAVLGGFVAGALVLTIGYSLLFLKKIFLEKENRDLTDYSLFTLLGATIIMMSCAIDLTTFQYMVLGGGIGLILGIANNENIMRIL